ncbi:unnamed protein product, partial [Linum tenue]
NSLHLLTVVDLRNSKSRFKRFDSYHKAKPAVPNIQPIPSISTIDISGVFQTNPTIMNDLRVFGLATNVLAGKASSVGARSQAASARESESEKEKDWFGAKVQSVDLNKEERCRSV